MGNNKLGRTNLSKKDESEVDTKDTQKQKIRTYLVKVYAVDGKGNKRRLGSAEIYTTSKTKARDEAFDELWDPKLPNSQFYPEMEVLDITNQSNNEK